MAPVSCSQVVAEPAASRRYWTSWLRATPRSSGRRNAQVVRPVTGSWSGGNRRQTVEALALALALALPRLIDQGYRFVLP